MNTELILSIAIGLVISYFVIQIIVALVHLSFGSLPGVEFEEDNEPSDPTDLVPK